MSQERLEALLLMATERKIFVSLNNEQIITTFGSLTSELAKALIETYSDYDNLDNHK